MMKRISAAVLLTAAFFLVMPPPAPSGEPSPEVARAGLAGFLDEIPGPELELLGLDPNADPAGIELGDPWRLYTIPPDRLLTASADRALGELIVPAGPWYFPVIQDGSWRAILTLAEVDGRWEAVALGKSPLAGELEKISRQWPAREGFTPRLVLVYQAGAYFFTIPEKGGDNLTPLIFDGAKSGSDESEQDDPYAGLSNLSEQIDPLRAAVAAALGAGVEGGPGQ